MEEEITRTTIPSITIKNTMRGVGWEIKDIQKEGEGDLKKSVGRIEEIDKLLVEKWGSPGERAKKEDGD